ncbi:WD40-repeat-containing domain protein [Panaeolus papilionaceus]|nr:WD40-repeat-containing domain protein [Panaeolus papilionaceus]
MIKELVLILVLLEYLIQVTIMVFFDTIFPADTLEFCPISGFQDVFVCGTYKLVDHPSSTEAPEDGSAPTPQTRRGQCLVFRTTIDKAGAPSFEQLQTLDFPAIPDVKWSYAPSNNPLLGVADSEGSITILEWRDSAFRQKVSVRCASEETLCLSLAWDNQKYQTQPLGSLVVSLSNGSVCVIRPRDRTGFSVSETWHAHDYEPWIATWDQWNPNIVYTGGDDLKMKGWDIRQSLDQPTFVNKRFEAGVTTIQAHPNKEHIIAVGSYNNTVQVFDVRNPLAPLTRIDVGGGVWRAKWHPHPERANDLLVACMHDGYKVVRFGEDTTNLAFKDGGWVRSRYDAHESLAYGADWSHAPASLDSKSLIGCCSFYDHKMSLWED